MKGRLTFTQWMISLSLVLLIVALFTPLNTVIFGTAGLMGTVGAWLIEMRKDKKDDNIIDVSFKVSEPKGADFDEKLRRIEELRSDGLITEDEYDRKRKEILKEKW